MGESILAPSVADDKMKGSLKNNGSALEVSVSFGRFESDSLSWEKWSTFSPNKYLDEVEKCATPGSVAQKKAYFEAHYKKIAARKMEEIEQEKEKEANFLNKNYQNEEDHVEIQKNEAHYKKIVACKMEEMELEKEKEDNFSSQNDQNGEDHVEKIYAYDDQAKKINIFQKNEAHYKKIVACKIEEMELEKQKEANFSSQNDQNGEVHAEKIYAYDDQAKKLNIFLKNEAHCKKIVACKIEETELEKQKEANFSGKNDQNSEDHVEKIYAYDDQAKNMNIFQNNSNCDESNESSTITIDSQCSVMDEIVNSRSSMIEETNEESVLVQGVTQINEIQEKIELLSVIDEERVHSNQSEDEAESVKKFQKKRGENLEKAKGKMDLDASKKSPKITYSGKEKSLTTTKKKLAPLSPKKIPEISTPKTQKPISKTLKKPISSPSLPTPSSSTKKMNSSSLPKTKKVAPSSLHMSITLAPTNDDSPSLPTNRSSLIMEKMADKDIVKRAFKSFQKSFNQEGASQNPSSSGHNEVLTSRPDQTVSTHQSEIGGMRRGVGKMDVQRAQLGRSLNSTLARSLKGVSMDQRHAKPAPSSSGVKSDEQRKDISKKLVEKSSTKEAERARLGTKSTEMETEIKKLRQNLNFKATPLPSFYRGHAASSKLV